MVRFFPRLLACSLISFIALVASMFAPTGARVVLGATALLPLVYYHLGYLHRQISSSADSAAVDSVYYYGFLITVAALAFSAMSLGFSGEVDLNSVLVKFGVGLFATGYAVIARMHLQSRIESTASSVEENEKRYRQRTRELIDDVGEAIASVKTFGETLTDVHTKRSAEVHALMLSAARSFQHEFDVTRSAARDSISEIRSTMSEITSAPERAELNKVVAEAATHARKLATSMTVFTKACDGGAERVTAANTAVEDLATSVRQLTFLLSDMSNPGGVVPGMATELRAVTNISAQTARSAHEAVAAASSLTKQLNESQALFAAMRSLGDATAAHFRQLTTTADHIDQALGRLSQSGPTADAFAENLRSATAAIQGVTGEIQTIAGQLDNLNVAVSRSASGLEQDVQRSRQATMLLVSSLGDVADNIVQRTRAHQGIS